MPEFWRRRISGKGYPVENVAFMVFTILFMIALYLALFMTTVYDDIPEQFGGGKPREASLLLPDDALASVQQLGIPDEDQKHFGTYKNNLRRQ